MSGRCATDAAKDCYPACAVSVVKVGNAQPGRRGRRRPEATDQAIVVAAADLIAQRGYDGFSMAAVADRAGVAKTTVYRRWPTRAHLALATISAAMVRVSFLDTGDVRADLCAFARSLAAALRAPGTRRLVSELAVAAAHRPELAEAFRRMFVQRRAAVLATVQRAAGEGHVRPDVDPELVIDQLSGALHYRMFLGGEGLTDAYADRLVEAVLKGALA